MPWRERRYYDASGHYRGKSRSYHEPRQWRPKTGAGKTVQWLLAMIVILIILASI